MEWLALGLFGYGLYEAYSIVTSKQKTERKAVDSGLPTLDLREEGVKASDFLVNPEFLATDHKVGRFRFTPWVPSEEPRKLQGWWVEDLDQPGKREFFEDQRLVDEGGESHVIFN